VPSLIIARCEGPGTRGVEALLQVRSRRWLERTPVVLVGRMDDRAMVTCYRMGAAAVVPDAPEGRGLRELIREFAVPATSMHSATFVGNGVGGAGRSAA
jgi:hypothetical protein